jgi:hypothetical protein
MYDALAHTSTFPSSSLACFDSTLTKMSKPAPNTILPDEKHDNRPPTEYDSAQKTEVVVDDPSENSFFRTFAVNDAEWHKAFEKKLMRKVDMRLVPLMIVMCVYVFVNIRWMPLT